MSLDGKKGLNYDVSTRWNSTFIILRDALLFKDVFQHLASCDPIASEFAFSTSRRILNDYRCSTASENVESLICTQSWIRDASNLCERTEKSSYHR
ncbi:putative AC transposase [Nymphaea thermarum]|nr:putative AC transposase [Nymphaea thermarum]